MPLSPTCAALHRPRLIELVAAAPKAELHVHIEGTLEPEMAFAIGRRNGITLPYATPGDMREAMAFSCLQEFLDLYYATTAVLQSERDFHDLAWAYLKRAQADGVVRTEIFFDPQAHMQRGVAFATVLAGLTRAVERSQAELGVSAALLMSFLRDRPVAEAHATLDAALPFQDAFIGVGLDSAEAGNPPEPFAEVFARCRQAGLHVVAHAGEEGPPASIQAALDVLGAERIDHGVRCLEDASLTARLAAERIPLTVCPLSNVRLQVVPSLAEHPLPALLAAGLRVSVHSDDPAYFGGFLNDTLAATLTALPLTTADAYALLRNSLESSFLEPQAIACHVTRLDAMFSAASEQKNESTISRRG